MVPIRRRGAGHRAAATEASVPPAPLAEYIRPSATGPARNTCRTSSGSSTASGTTQARLAIPTAIMLHHSQACDRQ